MTIKETIDILLMWYHLYRYNLGDWTVRFKNVFSYCGQTSYPDKVVTFYKVFVRNASLYELFEIICHEVAHIMTPEETEHHGPQWMNYNLALGGKKEICFDNRLWETDYRYESECLGCGYSRLCHIRHQVHCPECGNGLRHWAN